MRHGQEGARVGHTVRGVQAEHDLLDSSPLPRGGRGDVPVQIQEIICCRGANAGLEGLAEVNGTAVQKKKRQQWQNTALRELLKPCSANNRMVDVCV